jgi:hypothetical protein
MKAFLSAQMSTISHAFGAVCLRAVCKHDDDVIEHNRGASQLHLMLTALSIASTQGRGTLKDF